MQGLVLPDPLEPSLSDPPRQSTRSLKGLVLPDPLEPSLSGPQASLPDL